MNRRLLCYAFGRYGRWEAICIDFDLAVHGMSFRAVQDSLNAMIEFYVADALKEDAESSRQLLNRRVPFSTRARLALRLLWNLTASGSDAGGNYFAGYDISCRA